MQSKSERHRLRIIGRPAAFGRFLPVASSARSDQTRCKQWSVPRQLPDQWNAITQSEEGGLAGARRGTEQPPLTVLRSRTAPRKAGFHCVMIRQPTLVVAWVGICWHASAHKGCPVFPRWAPGLSTSVAADDRYCQAEATVVIRHHDQVEHEVGTRFH